MRKFINYIIVALLTFGITFGFCKCTNKNSNTEVPEVSSEISSNEKEENSFTVCIDAGHGFSDPGCNSPYLLGTEAKNTLEIAHILKAELEKLNIKVILTHNGNQFPAHNEILEALRENNISFDSSRIVDNNIFSAYERIIYASALSKTIPIDFFISLHINSIENAPDVNRYELYYYKDNPHAETLSRFCNTFAQKLDGEVFISSTESADSYTVTRYCDFPSILFEMGYATNPTAASNLNSATWRLNLCKNLALNIDEYLQQTRPNS